MKRLYLLRHAKSDWSDPSLGDFDRPLAPRGIKAAKRMGRAVGKKNLIPDAVLCSAARRAVETWDLLRTALPADVHTKVLRSLYLAAPSRLLQELRRRPDGMNAVMMIGHNPGLATLAERLSGPTSKQGALRRLHEKYPTAALAVIEFDVEHWSDVGEGAGRLTRFLCPKDLN